MTDAEIEQRLAQNAARRVALRRQGRLDPYLTLTSDDLRATVGGTLATYQRGPRASRSGSYTYNPTVLARKQALRQRQRFARASISPPTRSTQAAGPVASRRLKAHASHEATATGGGSLRVTAGPVHPHGGA